MIHYHGTPITPRATLLQLAGRSFCVSYAAPRDVEVCHEIGEGVLLDNGAFSFWTRQSPTDWPRFYAWVEPWLGYRSSWAVIPDVIDGDARANDRLLAGWPFGERGAPVWHPHEPLSRLGRLAAAWPRVCIGGSPAFATIRSSRWHARMREAMDYLCGSGPAPTWLHLLRGMALAGSDYPLASVDSSSVARNHHGAPSRGTAPRDPCIQITETDARQCPSRWRPAAPQLALLHDGGATLEESPGRDCVAPAWSAGAARCRRAQVADPSGVAGGRGPAGRGAYAVPTRKEPSMASTGTAPAPTARQQAFLRRLASSTGTSFATPRTRREASRQIDALMRRPISDPTDVALDFAAVRGGTPEVI